MAKFERGKSGNPSGRKLGTSAAQKLTKAIEKDLPEIISALVDAAKSGDVGAAKLLLDRVAPPLKPTAAPVNLDLSSVAPLPEQATAIVQAMARGAIPPDLAAAMVGSLATLTRLGAGTEPTSGNVVVYLPAQDPLPDD
jgi:hypothetical protein